MGYKSYHVSHKIYLISYHLCLPGSISACRLSVSPHSLCVLLCLSQSILCSTIVYQLLLLKDPIISVKQFTANNVNKYIYETLYWFEKRGRIMKVTRCKLIKSYYPEESVNVIARLCLRRPQRLFLLLGCACEARLEVKKKSCFNFFLAERLALYLPASEGRRTKDDRGCYVLQ